MVLPGQPKRRREEVQSIPARRLMEPPLEILQTTPAHLRPLGQRRLGEAGLFAKATEQDTEAGGDRWDHDSAPSPWINLPRHGNGPSRL